MYVTIMKNTLRVGGGHGKGLKEGSWEGMEGGNEGGSNVILFQLRTEREREINKTHKNTNNRKKKPSKPKNAQRDMR